MSLFNLPLMNALKNKLNWLEQRQNILGQNVANAATPGYHAHDLKELSFHDLIKSDNNLKETAVQQTSLAHMTPTLQSKFVQKERATEVALNENGVQLEKEMGKIGETVMDYRLLTTLYKKHISMLNTVIGGRG